ncbi:hypothetical protein GCK72_003356 [Caenorhabditis remanei]|uniref:DUF7154 domain-containing protein n=1 Tax=Caenorhabditis remanei TaxID=31234 RepID=A0A6A5HUR9_CAERE|nr:hypothetical protein GCK72_003356 [Caenorhabditis remanei]KAF1771529.1 hypothetical protein GCK72_003356 [Caenorhabditis remanei]
MKIPLPLHLLLFFSLIHFSNGCLKINILPPTTTLAPNTCHCEALPLNSTTIQAYIQPSNPFYLVLSTATLSAPTVSFDECSVMMWCDGDYSLVVFDDTSLGKIFGAYPANGFCDAESQEWLVDTREGLGLTRFNQLYGICFIAPTTPSTTSSTVTTPSTPSTTRSSTTVSSTVTTPRPTTTTPAPTSTTNPSTTRLSSSTTVSSTVTTPTTPSTTSPSTTTSTTVTSTTLICDCEYVALDRFTIRNYISSDNLFYNDLTSENVVLPIATNESCSVTMTCPTGYSMLVFDRTNLESENTHNVSTSTTHTTTTNSECTPTSRSTFVYAYSNDKFANEFHRIWPPRNQSRDFSDRMYSMYATIRFDTVAEDEIQYHTTWDGTGTMLQSELPSLATTAIYFCSMIIQRRALRLCIFESLAAHACRCEALPLNSTTIHAYIQPSNPFYLVLSTATLSAPTVSIDECSVMMWCDGDYSLVVFDDTFLGKIFGAYPANGFCDAESQEWLVDTRDGLGLTRFNQLYGICFIAPTTPSTTSSTVTTPSTPSTTRSSTTSSSTVTTPTTATTTPVPTSTTSPSTTRLSSSTTVSSTVTTATTPSTTSQATTTTTVTSTQSICNCEYVALDRFTIRNYISSDNLFYNDLTSETVALPTVTNESCSVKMTCPTGYSMLVFDRTNLAKLFGTPSASGQCDATSNKWKVDTGSRVKLTTFNQMYGICIFNEDMNVNYTLPSTLVSSTTTTPHSLPTTTTVRNECNETSVTTLVVAYSNDIPVDDFTTLWEYFDMIKVEENFDEYIAFANIRFDTVNEDVMQYHKSWEEMGVSIMERLPDPSLGFKDVETGSDVLKMIDNFASSTQSPVCRAKMYIFVSRHQTEKDIDKLVEKLRYHHIAPYLFVLKSSTGGFYPETLYDLATRTNGLCEYSDIYNSARLFPSLRLFHATNVVVPGGTGSFVRLFPRFIEEVYFLIISVQDYVPINSFKILNATWDNSVPLLQKTQSVPNVYGIWFMPEKNSTQLRFDYDYTGNTSTVVHIRVYQYTGYPPEWPAYTD